MDEKPGLQQFWHRSLLVMGILWGIIPLVTLPFIIRGTNDSSLDILAAISNGLTIFPASVLAFWHRRIACVWLSINGILVVTSVALFTLRTHEYQSNAIIGAAVSVLLAVSLVLMEIQQWPPCS